MDWDYPGTNVPSSVLGAAEGLGTNNMDEIELAGAPIDKVKRRFRRHSSVFQGPFPNVNVIMGSTCEAGCKPSSACSSTRRRRTARSRN